MLFRSDVVNLSFRCIFLYVALFNIRPPEAGISRKAVMPFLGFPSPAVFLRVSFEQRSCKEVRFRPCLHEGGNTHLCNYVATATTETERSGVEVRCKDVGIR